MVQEFNEQNFDEEVLQSGVPVLVDFWAPWCGPCKAMAPVIEELSKDYEGKAKVGKVNVDENKALAERYGIMSIPTIMMFKDGESMGQLVGTASKTLLAKKLDQMT